jgi:DNA polymerase III subunit beta
MKFTISKQAFLDAISQVQHVVSSRTTLAILSNVLLKARDGHLELTTTDLDVGVSGSVAAEVEIPGATTLPARRLATIIRDLPADEVSVTVDEKNVASIKSGAASFKLLGLGHDEYPALPRFDSGFEFVIEQSVLRECIKRTSYAISTDETRYVLNGILFNFKENVLTLVATDGRRLALVKQEMEFPESQATEFIVPTKAVNELSRLLSDGGQVVIRVTGSQAGFDMGRSLLVTKLIEGNYPNFRQVIPGDPKEIIELDREPLMRSVGRVALLAFDKSNTIKLRFAPGELEILASSPDVGEARELVPIVYNGPQITVAFNPEFLLAPLRNLATDKITFNLIDEVSPGVVKAKGGFLYVIMPMRVN